VSEHNRDVPYLVGRHDRVRPAALVGQLNDAVAVQGVVVLGVSDFDPSLIRDLCDDKVQRIVVDYILTNER
jgi:hypothetical protein